jgi:uroporphyrinogen decarboxylase
MHEQPDRVPYNLGFTRKARAAMDAWYGGDGYRKLVHNAMDGIGHCPGPMQKWISETVWQDEFGVRWDRSVDSDIGNVCNCVLPKRDLSTLKLPDPRDPARFEGFAERCAEGAAADRFVQYGIGFSLFERAWTLRGMENLFIDMIEAPAFVEDLLDRICDYNVALVEVANEA